MGALAIIFGFGLVMTGFWLGALFAVTSLELARHYRASYYRRSAAFNAAAFGLFSAAIWWLS